MKSIVLIISYFGKWPLWFDAHLVSIAANSDIHWLCPTDCEIPKNHPPNIKFLPTTLSKLNTRINQAVLAEVPLTYRKLCDLKLAYGDIFQEEIKEYDFWGICDMDIIWGDIRTFITEDVLSTYDIISSRKHNTSGHFTIFKNQKQLNTLYKSIPDYKSKLETVQLQRMDEEILTEYLWQKINHPSKQTFQIKWDSILCNQENGRDSHQEYYLDTWLWKDGKMLELKNGKPVNEVMYLHFINWKRTMKYSQVNYKDNPNSFYISYKGIHYIPHSGFSKALNGIKNLFNGYYAILSRKHILKKIKKRLK
ncbi:DUF6625 family protein [uncultured Marixanthomonas sp.]|uniref:DUF6625 family protein n=1 Tax=uncultured Marixanthomonas sp. TaxID=757245 RepID=UPI0030D86C82